MRPAREMLIRTAGSDRTGPGQDSTAATIEADMNRVGERSRNDFYGAETANRGGAARELSRP